MIIGISGKKGSGKNTVGNIIQYLTMKSKNEPCLIDFEEWMTPRGQNTNFLGSKCWQIKKYADKLKEIGCILLGCKMSDWEDREFKEKELGEEWWVFIGSDGITFSYLEIKNDNNFMFDQMEFVKHTPRSILQLLGTEGGRDLIHPNLYVNSLMFNYKPLPKTRKFEVSGTLLLNKNIYYGECITCKKKVCSSNKRFVKCDKCVDEEEDNYPNWIITDVERPNELKAIEDRKGFIIRVNRTLKTSEEWQKEYPDIIVYDPDGWDRSNYDYSWKEELIDFKEYQKRLMYSTCKFINNGKKFEQYLQPSTHPSETALDNYKFKYTIENNGTIEELVEKVKIILEKEKVL